MGRFCQKEQILIRSETHGHVSTSLQLLTKFSVGKQITILLFFLMRLLFISLKRFNHARSVVVSVVLSYSAAT